MDTTWRVVLIVALLALILVVGFVLFRKSARFKLRLPGVSELDGQFSGHDRVVRIKGRRLSAGNNVRIANPHGDIDAKDVSAGDDIDLSSQG